MCSGVRWCEPGTSHRGESGVVPLQETDTCTLTVSCLPSVQPLRPTHLVHRPAAQLFQGAHHLEHLAPVCQVLRHNKLHGHLAGTPSTRGDCRQVLMIGGRHQGPCWSISIVLQHETAQGLISIQNSTNGAGSVGALGRCCCCCRMLLAAHKSFAG